MRTAPASKANHLWNCPKRLDSFHRSGTGSDLHATAIHRQFNLPDMMERVNMGSLDRSRHGTQLGQSLELETVDSECVLKPRARVGITGVVGGKWKRLFGHGSLTPTCRGVVRNNLEQKRSLNWNERPLRFREELTGTETTSGGSSRMA